VTAVAQSVPGDPADLDRLVARCGAIAQGLGDAAARVRAIDAGEWVGPAGDAFRSVLDVEPARFEDAAAAFGATASAVRAYAGVLRDAQAAARSAMALDDDEGSRAETLLADAGQRVQLAGASAARTIAVAWERAPREPHWWEDAGHVVAEIGRGAWEATAGTVEFAWQVSSVRMMVDPEGWTRDLAVLELGKALVDWDTWQESPGRAIGHLVPDLLVTLASGGAGSAARGARAVSEVEDVSRTFTRLDRLGESRLGYLQRARNLLSGEALPAPNVGRHTPAGIAARWQSAPPYGGVDNWFNATLRTGDLVGAGSVKALPDLPFRGFAVPADTAASVGTDARRLFEGVQVNPVGGAGPDRPGRARGRRAAAAGEHRRRGGDGGGGMTSDHGRMSRWTTTTAR